jgi:hypothetical protein
MTAYRLQSHQEQLEVSCPQCDTPVPVTALWNPRDHDGPPYYTEIDVHPCPSFCRLTPADLRVMQDHAAAELQARLDG